MPDSAAEPQLGGDAHGYLDGTVHVLPRGHRGYDAHRSEIAAP